MDTKSSKFNQMILGLEDQLEGYSLKNLLIPTQFIKYNTYEGVDSLLKKSSIGFKREEIKIGGLMKFEYQISTYTDRMKEWNDWEVRLSLGILEVIPFFTSLHAYYDTHLDPFFDRGDEINFFEKSVKDNMDIISKLYRENKFKAIKTFVAEIAPIPFSYTFLSISLETGMLKFMLNYKGKKNLEGYHNDISMLINQNNDEKIQSIEELNKKYVGLFLHDQYNHLKKNN